MSRSQQQQQQHNERKYDAEELAPATTSLAAVIAAAAATSSSGEATQQLPNAKYKTAEKNHAQTPPVVASPSPSPTPRALEITSITPDTSPHRITPLQTSPDPHFLLPNGPLENVELQTESLDDLLPPCENDFPNYDDDDVIEPCSRYRGFRSPELGCDDPDLSELLAFEEIKIPAPLAQTVATVVTSPVTSCEANEKKSSLSPAFEAAQTRLRLFPFVLAGVYSLILRALTSPTRRRPPSPAMAFEDPD